MRKKRSVFITRTILAFITGLTTTGDTATYTIQNKSADLSASVNTNSNDTYFEVTPVINSPTTIEAQ